MEKFVKGSVVVLPFPFSDLSGSKYRPALVLADLPGDDIMLCQITSRQVQDAFAIPLLEKHSLTGKLPVLPTYVPTEFLRPAKKSLSEAWVLFILPYKTR